MSSIVLERMMQISVDQYHRMIDTGILNEDDRVELLDGYMVNKMPNHPLHVSTLHLLASLLAKLLPQGKWHIRIQSPVTLSRSEPEPDIVVAQGLEQDYFEKHPQSKDTALLVEVAESSLKQDQTTKQEIYARDGVKVYWIVNLVQKVVEVYTMPTGPAAEPVYRRREVCSRTDRLPVELDGNVVGTIQVSDLFPNT